VLRPASDTIRIEGSSVLSPRHPGGSSHCQTRSERQTLHMVSHQTSATTHCPDARHLEARATVAGFGLQTDQAASKSRGFPVIRRFYRRLAVSAGMASPVPGVVPGTVLKMVFGASLRGLLYVPPGAFPRAFPRVAGRMVRTSLWAAFRRAVGRALPRRARRMLPPGVRRTHLRAASRALWKAACGALPETMTRTAVGIPWQAIRAIRLWVRLCLK
jgi:hypothetical protein